MKPAKQNARAWDVRVRRSFVSTSGRCMTCGAADCQEPDEYLAGRLAELFFTVYGIGHTRASAIGAADAASRPRAEVVR